MVSLCPCPLTRPFSFFVLSLPFNQQQLTGNYNNCQKQAKHTEKFVDQEVILTAGKRLAGRERWPFGRPGDMPQGFRTLTGLPSCGRRWGKPRRTRAGVSFSIGRAGCQGKR